MTAVVNGERLTLDEGVTVAQLVASVTEQRRGVVVAVNRTLVARSAWERTLIGAGDNVEILTASQGG